MKTLEENAEYQRKYNADPVNKARAKKKLQERRRARGAKPRVFKDYGGMTPDEIRLFKNARTAAAYKKRCEDPSYKEGEKQKKTVYARKRRNENPEIQTRETEYSKRRYKLRAADPIEKAEMARVTKKSRTSRRLKMNLLKQDRPCYDCGGVFPPEAMEWDHLPGREKCFTIGSSLSRDLDKVVDEIAKCQLVCSCCHRIRTEARRPRNLLCAPIS